jgi:serine/threonine protein phosphatase PrpC
MAIDADIKNESYAEDEGCTACAVLVTTDKIYCCNAGDSRAVLMRGSTAIGLSEDHKPDNDDESRRI